LVFLARQLLRPGEAGFRSHWEKEVDNRVERGDAIGSRGRLQTESVCEQGRVHRHPRESGDPEVGKRGAFALDSRFRGNDVSQGYHLPAAREAFHTPSESPKNWDRRKEEISLMLLPHEEGAVFIRLYSSLIGFACGRLGGVEGVKDLETFHSVSLQARAKARDRLLENISLVERFVEENPHGFQPNDLPLVLEWKRFVRGRFIIERDLKEYTVFLSEDEPPKAYGVVALNSEFVELSPGPLPALASAVLLPWKGRIVCDGLVGFSTSFSGPGSRRVSGILTKKPKSAASLLPSTPAGPLSRPWQSVDRRRPPSSVSSRGVLEPWTNSRNGTANRAWFFEATSPRSAGCGSLMECRRSRRIT